MHEVFKLQCKKYQNTNLEVDFSPVNSEVVFYTKIHCILQEDGEKKKSFGWFGLGWREDPFNKVADIILFGMCFGKSSNLSKPLTCTMSITSGLPLKGILEHVNNSTLFLRIAFNLWMLLSWNICSILIIQFTSLLLD